MSKLLIFLAVLVILGGLVIGREAKQVKNKINNRVNQYNSYLNELEG